MMIGIHDVSDLSELGLEGGIPPDWKEYWCAFSTLMMMTDLLNICCENVCS